MIVLSEAGFAGPCGCLSGFAGRGRPGGRRKRRAAGEGGAALRLFDSVFQKVIYSLLQFVSTRGITFLAKSLVKAKPGAYFPGEAGIWAGGAVPSNLEV